MPRASLRAAASVVHGRPTPPAAAELLLRRAGAWRTGRQANTTRVRAGVDSWRTAPRRRLARPAAQLLLTGHQHARTVTRPCAFLAAPPGAAPAAGESAAANTLSKHSPAVRLPTRRATSCQKKLCVGSTWQ
jgi:hypothetical protein